MLLEKLTLQNVRTYTNAEITFPENSTLLCGDIGSGKSSILLAIEFALFGIMRGELSGESILRKDSTEAKVILSLKINEKKIEICRTLKKGQKGISQTFGYIIENGIKTEGTPVELKSKILTLLGYPQSLLSGKNLLYRYTVYTPQEELKRIIQEDSDLRLDVLRKVLLIDKYKTIRNNIQIYTSSMREKIIQAQTKLEALPEKKQERMETKERLEILEKQKIVLEPQHKELKEKKQKHQQLLQSLEDKMELFRKQKQELAMKKQALQSIQDQLSSLNMQKKTYDQKIVELPLEKPVEHLKKQLIHMEHALKNLEEKHRQATQTKIQTLTKLKISEEKKEKITSLDSCPTCLQNVTQAHKHTIVEKENEYVENLQKQIKDLPIDEILNQKEQQKNTIETIKKTIQETELSNVKRKQIIDYQKYLEDIKKETIEKETKLKTLDVEIVQLQQSIEKNTIEETYSNAKKTYENIIEEEQTLITTLTKIKTSIEEKSAVYDRLVKEIQALHAIEIQLKKQKGIINWLKDHFINLLDVMEKHVFFRIQQEFNELFQEWFSILIEDEHIQARVDETFSPIIEQNGYEIEFSNLSGGEKSSVALAYRLALNNVINTLVNSIHTTDFLVLDEPTDGFSGEQLDKLKDVLEQIKVKQLIVVSHEPKVESFVQNIIRIEKHNGVSVVLQ